VSLRAQDNRQLQSAFPTVLREEVLAAISALPENPHGVGTFTVRVSGEHLSIPYRVYHNAALIHTAKLSPLQGHLVDCILTRHRDGLIRQKHLTRIVKSTNAWVPAFVVQLLGEYVKEIIQVIYDNIEQLDKALYKEFLQINSAFLALTEKRVYSYWDCYYRSVGKEEYAGFKVLRFFKNLAGQTM
jgi:hypothetical protein